jgi:hypothetical protein
MNLLSPRSVPPPGNIKDPLGPAVRRIPFSVSTIVVPLLLYLICDIVSFPYSLYHMGTIEFITI